MTIEYLQFPGIESTPNAPDKKFDREALDKLVLKNWVVRGCLEVHRLHPDCDFEKALIMMVVNFAEINETLEKQLAHQINTNPNPTLIMDGGP